MHRGDGAGGRDPQLEDLVQRLVRRRELSTAHYAGTPLLIEDSEIDCQNTSGTAIGEANVTARRLNIHGCENGFNISQNVTVEDSYIHDMYNSAEAHTDGIQFATGHFVNGQLVSGRPQHDDPPQHDLRDGRRRVVRHLGDHRPTAAATPTS